MIDDNDDRNLKERPSFVLPQAAASASTSSSLPSFPSEIKKLSELTDGVGLCAVVSLYCPNELPWTDVALGEPPSMADSLYNIQVGLALVDNADTSVSNCCNSLPGLCFGFKII